VGTTLRRLGRDRAALGFAALALVVVMLLAGASVYADEVAGTTPVENHISEQITLDGDEVDVVSLDGIPIGPTWHAKFLLGADENGRDLAVRLLYGIRTSLLVAGGAVLLTIALAVPLALTAGYAGGRLDAAVGRLLDLIWSFPVLLLGVLLGTAVRATGADIGPVEVAPGSKLVPIGVIGLVSVPYVARPLRSLVHRLREQQFVEAARASGLGPLRIVTSEVLPHLWSTLLVLATLLFANAVAFEAALSFLGAGVEPPEPSLGSLIATGVDTVSLSAHLLVVPCVALMAIVMVLSGLAEGLRRALDPRSGLRVGPEPGG
jgi:peptide/nickel transport system permease protein